MTTLNGIYSLPPDLISYIQQSAASRNSPILPVRALKCLADRIPTSFLSETAHRSINLVGDVAAGNNNLTKDYEYKKIRDARIKYLMAQMGQATSLLEYETCTMELDVLQGHDAWKTATESIEPFYDPKLIQRRLAQLQAAAETDDIRSMGYLLRTTLSRDLGGMGMLRLYKHTWFGTKHLIDDYINAAVNLIDRFLEVAALLNMSTAEASSYQQTLEDSLKFFGRSALTLSGGANLGMKHIGVAKALWEAELLPEIISGASAGSIVAAIVASSTDEELPGVLERFPRSDLAVFDTYGTAGLGWAKQRLLTFHQTHAFFNIKNLQRVMKSWIADITFREAHNKTGRVLNICVSSTDGSEARLLNYITAPDVFIWSAVCASCSVPFVFQPATIYEKHPITKEQIPWMQSSQQLFVDGSLDHDIPMRKLSEMFNVNFFIVSQVNPHVRMFLEPEEEFTGVQPTTKASKRSIPRTCAGLVRGEIIHRAQQAADLGAPRIIWRGASILNQQYTGDINILPEIEPLEYLSMMANPTPESMQKASIFGERATWPKMCRIKNSVAIELSLMKAIHELRDRVNFSPEARAERQAVQATNRGRTRSVRPRFLRRRSLSHEYTQTNSVMIRASGPPSPSPGRTIRRNTSAGSLIEKLYSLTQGDQPKALAPQAGIDDDHSDDDAKAKLAGFHAKELIRTAEPSLTDTESVPSSDF